MADFIKMAAPNHYIGASTDTKPTSVAVGSRCYEHDTKKWFITQDGGTTWTETQDLDALVILGMGEVQASPTANTLLARMKEAVDGLDELMVLVGEVQASPTENSLLERQKAIETALTAINTLIGAIAASPTENTVMDRLKEVEDGIDELKVLIGAVTASPTENTLLERLKAIETTLLTLVVLGTGSNVIGKVGHDVTGIGHGVETCDAAGTDQSIVTSSTPAKMVNIQAQTDNTSAIAVGGSGVDATVATGTGQLLYAGDWTGWMPCDNLADIYFDALVTDEGVRFIYAT